MGLSLLSEGCFDNLSCYFNIHNQKTDNSIYSAVCGSGYLNTIRLFLKMGFIKNLNIKIYSDKDHSPSFYNNLKELSNLYKSLTIYYNGFKDEKDIGVVKERIMLTKAVF